MPSWRRVFTSEEAFVESKAGACPPEGWPNLTLAEAAEEIEKAMRVGPRERKRRVLTDAEREDVLLQLEHLRAEPRWPAGMPSPPPFPADDEGKAEPDE